MRAGVYAIATDMAIQLRLGKIASTRPREQQVNPLANFFKTADDRWRCMVPRTNGSDWPDIARTVGLASLAEDPRFAGGRARRANGPELVRLLDQAFGAMSLAEARARLDAADVVWSPVQTAAEMAADPQAEAAGCFVQIPVPAGGSRRIPAVPARFPGADDGPKGPAPGLGEHTRAVLAELGYGAGEIEALIESGAAQAPIPAA
jgi:crotonobetainyl-CoA:carnitine CoA-transferase CaiB-like acyl-CoA transferase